MKFSFYHNNINVFNLEKSLEFYQKALGLTITREKEAGDGSFKLIPAILFSVRLFPQPDAPRIPIRDAPLRNRTSNRKSPSTFFISTDNPIFFYHLFTFFIFLPDSRFIKTIITNAIKITTATQIPAVR